MKNRGLVQIPVLLGLLLLMVALPVSMQLVKDNQDIQSHITTVLKDNSASAIIIVAPSIELANSLDAKLDALSIKHGLFHNYIKSRTLLDENNKVITIN
jgi:hypothetical protein